MRLDRKIFFKGTPFRKKMAPLKASEFGHKTQEELYRKRPNLILDSIVENARYEVVFDGKYFKLKRLSTSPANRQTFREIISNAIDNVRRALADRTDPGTIKVIFENVPTKGKNAQVPLITVSNGGSAPTLDIHPVTNVPVPQMIWGILNTSSNYEDSDDRRTGGQNGVGGKGCNLFSVDFTVTIWNADEGKKWVQIFQNFVPGEAKITKYSGKENKVQVSYHLDDSVLGMPNPEWYAWDVASATISAPSVELTIGDETYTYKNCTLSDFLKFYPPVIVEQKTEETTEEKIKEIVEETTEEKIEEIVEENAGEESDLKPQEQRRRRNKKKKLQKKLVTGPYDGPAQPEVLCSWKDAQGNEVVVADIHKTFHFPQVVGWVNGLPCHRGAHVEPAKAVFAKAFEQLLMSSKETEAKLAKYRTEIFPKLIKDNVLFLIRTEGSNPFFGAGQVKGDFEGFKIRVGEDKNGNPDYRVMKPDLSMFDPEAKTNPMGKEPVKWGNWKESRLMDVLNNYWKNEAEKNLSKTDGKNKKFVNAKGLENANWAGTKNAKYACLIGGEGQSALEYLREWVAQHKDGKDKFGLIAYRGKLINTMNATLEDLAENKEIILTKQALGLQEGMDYSVQANFETLRYQEAFIISSDSDSDGTHIKGLILVYFYHRFPSLIKRGFIRSNLSPSLRLQYRNESLRFYRFEAYLKWLRDENIDEQERTKREKAKPYYLKGLGSCNKEDIIDDFRVNKYVTYIMDEKANESMHLAFDDEFAEERKDWLLENSGSAEDPIDNEQTITRFINDDLTIFFHLAIVRAIPKYEDGLKEVQRKLLWSLYNVKEMTKVPTLSATASKETAYHHGEAISTALVKMTQVYTGSTYNLPLFVGNGRFGSRASGGKSAKFRYIAAKISPVTAKLFPKEDFPLLTLRYEEGNKIEPEFMLPIIPISLVNGASGVACGWSTFIPSYDPKAVIINMKRLLTGKSFNKMIPWYRGYGGVIEMTEEGFASKGILNKIGKSWKITELPLFVWTLDFDEKLRGFVEEKKIRDVKDKSKPETVDFTINGLTPESLGVKKDDMDEDEWFDIVFKFLGLRTTHSMKNMVLRKGEIPYRYDTVEEIMKDFIEFRLPYYEKRREYNLQLLQKEIVTQTQHLALLRLAVDKKIDLTADDLIEKATALDQTLTPSVIEEILDKKNLRSIRKDGLEKIQKALDKSIHEMEQLESVSAVSLWIADLDALAKVL